MCSCVRQLRKSSLGAADLRAGCTAHAVHNKKQGRVSVMQLTRSLVDVCSRSARRRARRQRTGAPNAAPGAPNAAISAPAARAQELGAFAAAVALREILRPAVDNPYARLHGRPAPGATTSADGLGAAMTDLDDIWNVSAPVSRPALARPAAPSSPALMRPASAGAPGAQRAVLAGTKALLS